MKKSICFLFIFSVAVSNKLYSQHISFSAKYSLNFANLDNFKKIQTDALEKEGVPVPLKIVDNFQSRPGVQVNAELIDLIPNFSIGVLYDYSSTGGKIHYQDYSGEISYTQRSNRNIFGGSLSYLFQSENKNFIFSIGGNGLMIFSNFVEDDFIQIGTQRISQKFEFESTSLGIEPKVSIGYQIYFIVLKTELSYLKDIGAELKLKQNDKVNFVYTDGSTVKSDWSGGRINFTIGVYF